jgi:peptidoglycan/LPS O-acetylase OafA/YrhL
MAKMDKGRSPTTTLLRRIARIFSAALIAFTLVMVVGHLVTPDPYEVDYDPIENILPLTMCLSVFALAIAWRWEGVGNALLVFLPLPVTALLFLYCWYRSRSS